MCSSNDPPANRAPGGKKKRKKLWEIQEGYHCSIVGTCLGKGDLQTLSRKKAFSLSSKTSDYNIHSVLVGLASVRQPQSRYLQKMMDEKYRQAIARYRSAESDEQIRILWEEDFEAGRVAGAYWAVMTHPVPTYDLINEIYGRIHMLGHECMSKYQSRKKAVEKTRGKVTLLEDVLASERQIARETTEALELSEKKISSLEKLNADLTETVHRLEEQMQQIQSGYTVSKLTKECERLHLELATSKEQCSLLYSKIEAMALENNQARDELERKRSEVANKKQMLVTAHMRQSELERELRSLEAVVCSCADDESDCTMCSDRDTERCPGPNLCGKLVLYVGGMHNLVPRYRKLVEEHGGRFMHHDGGREAARSMLPKLLSTADAVVCPVDCVSHDACTCVKKICKRDQKPFVMMRSSGLSSLVRGIAEIVQ